MPSVEPRLLAYWIQERERVRFRKEIGKPKPWSTDLVFQDTYFCNVHREDDKVTRWIAEHWRRHEHPWLTEMMVCARMFNLPDHLAELPKWWEYDLVDFPLWLREAKAASHELKADGYKTFNGAYIVSTCGRKMDKIDYVYDVVTMVRHDVDLTGVQTLKEAWRRLTTVNGLGSFLAAQVVADLKNAPNHPLQNASDWWTWCAPGPGSLRGIRWVEGFEGTSQSQFMAAAARLYGVVAPMMGDLFPIHMQDFQNCLCEFDKYCRVRHGTGRSKRIYNGV